MEMRATLLRAQPLTLWLQRGQDALVGPSSCPQAARASLPGFICLRGSDVILTWICWLPLFAGWGFFCFCWFCCGFFFVLFWGFFCKRNSRQTLILQEQSKFQEQITSNFAECNNTALLPSFQTFNSDCYSLNYFVMFLSSFCQSNASLFVTWLFLWVIFVFVLYLIFFMPPEQSQKTPALVLKVAREDESAFMISNHKIKTQ